jgi:hypothetical protein
MSALAERPMDPASVRARLGMPMQSKPHMRIVREGLPEFVRVAVEAPVEEARINASCINLELPAFAISTTGEAHFAFQEMDPVSPWPMRGAHWRLIAREVAQKHKVRVSDLLSNRRFKDIVTARHEAFWRCREETAMSLTQIGLRFNKDHTTVLHGIRRYEGQRVEEING